MKLSKLILASSLALTAMTASNTVFAGSEPSQAEKKWDVLAPDLPLKQVSISTEQTTWSNLTLAKDGQSFFFDMLGDIYQVDIEGGQARAITEDFAWNIQPSVSPDGKSIAFISDRGGISSLWLMDLNGENKRQISQFKEDIVHSPAWSPDGKTVAVTKGIMSGRSIPAGEIWLFNINGGSGIKVKARVNGEHDQKNIADAKFSPDGKYLYYTRDITPGRTFSYNRDALKGLFAVIRYELATGVEETLISGVGGAIVPTPSPDGQSIAYIRRVNEKTALFVKDLKSGIETPLNTNMERDLQEGFGSEGYYSYFEWTQQGDAIVYWSKGQFQQIDVNTKAVTPIPVKIDAKLQVADPVRPEVVFDDKTFDVKMARWAQTSPDGKKAVFQALGKIYVKDIKSGKLKRLTKQNDHDEFYPRFSPNGKHIVYTTWNDEKLGSIRLVKAKGGKGKVLSKAPGHYVEPSFSADGKQIAYRKFSGGYILSSEWSLEPGLYVTDIKGKSHKRVSKSGYQPHFSGDDNRLYFTNYVPGSHGTKKEFLSVNLSGDLNANDQKVHVTGKDVTEFRLSPDKQTLAFVHQNKAYIADYVEYGQKQDITPSAKQVVVKRVSKQASENLHWSADTLQWSYSDTLYSVKLDQVHDEGFQALNDGLSLSFKKAVDKPKGVIAFTNANVVTMRDADNQQEIIKQGVVVVEGERIIAVGQASEVNIPNNAQVVDLAGKTLLPGLIDAHAHGAQGREEIIPQQNWINYSGLSFGVTTIHDPSNDTSEIFAASELQKAGKLIAPRIFSTGTILYGAKAPDYKAQIDNYDDAKFHMQRLKSAGAVSVKSYNQPRRDQRQQVLVASRELDMLVVPEGGGKFHQNLTMLLDGHTGLEHALPIARGYDDVTQLWSQTDFGYTPTFVVAYGGLTGEKYWYDRTNVWQNERLMQFVPKFIVEPISVRRQKAPDSHYNHIEIAKYAKELRDNGVRVMIGAHGQREGLGAHWEMWMMAQGGFTPWEALRGATYDGAKHLGMDKQIGSLEVGKLADMIVIDGDVLSDIRLSERVSHTMINGRLYNAATMNELFDRATKREPFYFERLDVTSMPTSTQKAIEAKKERHHWVH
ncbi:PD40 domain-containing protein [Catenovulum sp. SM1970]|uniref:amidohydrolase family protein n=1 Tax=Marinifaba aquimaris TaxID=2741323 RepID=UPI0015733F1A|nr:amidohydrolase family protein [Marinifaba aquimaris]NTS75335.1 PD40 domain-containing protein [Marinifaba aquimaris]